ncbi:hypothetical protein ASG74_14645 [Knoellia sp. Soil729]|nr:hypothetical protein ASG74_14645 [Knoellia sp. Soil729]
MVATKLYVPSVRPGLVTRDRLLGRLEDGASRRLTLVSAPAGFGKTTLVASWLARPENDRAVAWLSLDAGDADLSVFWTGVVTALRGAFSRRGTEPAAQLAGLAVSADAMVPAIVNYLADSPDEVLLVLDDYHLADHPEVAAGMTFLVEHLPPNAHVVMCTRADPDLALARWRARGELVEVRAVDLRFTAAETAAYLEGTCTTRLTVGQVRALEDRTEGWIAALQLAAISLQDHADVGRFIEGFAGDDRYVVDYLIEEVLAHQKPVVRDFLLRSAVLDRFCAPLCDVLMGGEGADGMLRVLDRANLFLVALDDKRQWYRYHHLFADVLRARLFSEQPEVIPLLHRRASDWFENHDLADPAIRHALAAGDLDRASALIEAAMPAVRRERQEGVAQTWLHQLPEDVIRRRPALAVLSAGLLLVAGDLDGVSSRLDEAEEALAAAQDAPTDGQALAQESLGLPATIAIYRASLAQAHGDIEATVRHAQVALDLAAPEDHLARGGAAGFLGLSAWAQGDVPRALVTFQQAVHSLHAAGNVVDELTGTVVLADLWRASGRPRRAREICDEALRRAETQGIARAAAELDVALAELDIESGGLDSARRHLDSAAGHSRGTAITESLFRSSVAEALLARAAGDFASAFAHLQQAEQLYRPGFFPDLRPIASLRARFQICEGDHGVAAEWAQERGVSLDEPVGHLREYDHLTLVRLMVATHRNEPDSDTINAVLALLERLGEAARASGRARSLTEIRMLTALALDAHGRRPDALMVLGDAWELAPEPDGYVRLFLDEGTPMTELLRAAQRHQRTSHHAQRLLASAGTATAATHLRPSTSVDELSERELEVLALLDSDLRGPEIARALFISHNTLRTHTKHIFTKLGVSSRRAAVMRARERSVMPPTSG